MKIIESKKFTQLQEVMKTFKLYRLYFAWGELERKPLKLPYSHTVSLELKTDKNTYMTDYLLISPSEFKRAYHQLKKKLENLCENNETPTL